jgi:LuxR family maltose regulon positive regulatory protein
MTTERLVDTKLFLPRARQGLVPRPRLDELFGTGRARMTLVSAPAGFG